MFTEDMYFFRLFFNVFVQIDFVKIVLNNFYNNHLFLYIYSLFIVQKLEGNASLIGFYAPQETWFSLAFSTSESLDFRAFQRLEFLIFILFFHFFTKFSILSRIFKRISKNIINCLIHIWFILFYNF